MKKFCLKLVLLSIITSLISISIFCFVEFSFKETYKNNYQKGWVYQYRALQNTDASKCKIMILGSSYVTFGVDIDRMAKETGMPVYSVGIHSGMGMNYIFETIEKFVNKDDIVIFPFLYVKEVEYGMDLINISLDGEPDLYFDFFKNHPIEVIKSIGKTTYQKLYTVLYDYFKDDKQNDLITLYDARAFDKKTGNYIFDRPECIANTNDLYDWSFDFNEIDKDYIEKIKKLIKICQDRKAKFYMAYAPIVKSSVISSNEEIYNYSYSLEKTFNVDFLFDLKEVFVDLDYVYDLPMHMNNKGVIFYTNKIIEGIKKYQHLPKEN